MTLAATTPRPAGRSTHDLIETTIAGYIRECAVAERVPSDYTLARRIEEALEAAGRLVPTEAVSYPGTGHTHSEWSALPTKEHLPTDDLDAPGTGPDGWGIYLADDPGEGYFAWMRHKAEAEMIVSEHNAAVRAALGEEEG